jgi:paraquat-inducible protein B
LTSADLGSLDVGSPVYFRRLQVGQISAYDLDPGGRGVTLRVFVNSPYDRFVAPDTRFWHASGIDVTLDTTGAHVSTQSLISILIGGIAFETPDASVQQPAAAAHTAFTLYLDRAEAMKRHDRIVDKYMVNFSDSVRGLTVGAPVDFEGIVVGEVTGIYTGFDPATRKISIPVELNLYPERFTSRYLSGKKGGRLSEDPKALTDYLVNQGMRVQLRTGNLLTGQLYLALDFFPDAPKAKVDWAQSPPQLPSVPSPLQSLQDSLARLVAKLNGVPFDAIGKNAQQTLQTANAMLARLDTEVTPQARDALAAARTAIDSANSALQPDSPLQQNASDAMRELSRSAAALRMLADYLERHPEAIVRGKKGQSP